MTDTERDPATGPDPSPEEEAPPGATEDAAPAPAEAADEPVEGE